MAETKLVQIHASISPEVKRLLITDSREQERSFNDVAVGILAERFSVRFQGTGRRSPGSQEDGETDTLLRVPPRLAEKIEVAYARAKSKLERKSKAAYIDRLFREHYDLELDAAAVAA